MNNYGLNDDYKYEEIYLDSLDATVSNDPAYASTDYPLFIFARPFKNIAAFKILSAQIPYTYYTINSNNNTFRLNELGFDFVTISLPQGNYSPNSMADTLATVLSTNSPNDFVYVVNYSAQTNNFSITNTTGGPTAFFSLIFGDIRDTGNNNPRLYLGFGPALNTSNLLGTTQVLISGAVQFGANYLYVNSQTIGNLVQSYLPLGATNLNNGDVGPQIGKIDTLSNPNGVIFYTDPYPQKWFSMENLFNLSSLELYCTLGNTNHVMEFNGQSFSVKIGMLVQNPNRVASQGATYGQGRVQTRVVPQ